MQKIIFAVIVAVLLSGCATQNPGYQTAQKAGGVVGGAIVGDQVAKVAGANRTWRTVAAVAGATTGVAVVEGMQCSARGDCPDEAAASSSYNPFSPMRPGMCADPRGGAGAQISCQFLADNPCYARWGKYGPNATCPESRILEANGSRSPATVSKAVPQQQVRAGNSFGLTVENYLDSPVIPSMCRTGNYGRDANCLSSEVQVLEGKQRACEDGTGSCRRDFNFGEAAGAFRDLSAQLRGRQVALQSQGR